MSTTGKSWKKKMMPTHNVKGDKATHSAIKQMANVDDNIADIMQFEAAMGQGSKSPMSKYQIERLVQVAFKNTKPMHTKDYLEDPYVQKMMNEFGEQAVKDILYSERLQKAYLSRPKQFRKVAPPEESAGKQVRDYNEAAKKLSSGRNTITNSTVSSVANTIRVMEKNARDVTEKVMKIPGGLPSDFTNVMYPFNQVASGNVSTKVLPKKNALAETPVINVINSMRNISKGWVGDSQNVIPAMAAIQSSVAKSIQSQVKRETQKVKNQTRSFAPVSGVNFASYRNNYKLPRNVSGL